MAKSARRLPRPKEPFASGTLVLLDQLRRDVHGQWTDNRLEQATHYRGVIYVAIRAVMDALLSSTVQINRKHRRYRQVSLRRQEKALPTPSAHAEDEQFRPFDDPDHSLVKLVDQPNRTETFNEILSQVVLQYMLTGSGLLWANPDRIGIPRELYVLPTALCYAQPPNPDYPEGWWRVQQYYPAGGYGILPSPLAGGGAPVDARDVFVFKNPHPLWRWDAMSPLTAGSVQLDILESIDVARRTAMEMGLTPDMVLLAPGVSQTQLDVYLERLKQTNVGKRNHRKVMAIGGDQGDAKFDVKFPAATAKDMDFGPGWDQMTAYALALFGVPKSVAGLATTGSYAELYAALKQFHTLTLRPLVARMGVWLTRHLARPWGKDLAIQLDLPTIDDQQLQEQQLSTDLQHDGLTYNEYRALRGRKPVPGGEVLVSVYVQQQQAKAQQAQQAANPQPTPQPGAAPDQAATGAGQQQPTSTPNGVPPSAAGGPAEAGAPVGAEQPDALSQLLGTGTPGGDDEHVQNATTDAALAALGVPPEAGAPAGPQQKAYEPTHLKGRWPGAPKPVAAKTATPAGAKPAPTPSTSDALTKQQLTNREPGEEYPGPSGKVFKQTPQDTPAPKPKDANAVPPPKPKAVTITQPKQTTAAQLNPADSDAFNQGVAAQKQPPAPAAAPQSAKPLPAPTKPGAGTEVYPAQAAYPTATPVTGPAQAIPVAPPGSSSPNGPGQPAREQTAHDTKKPGEFAPKGTPQAAAAPQTVAPPAPQLPAGVSLDQAAEAIRGGHNVWRVPSPTGGGMHEIRSGADLKAYFDAGGTLSPEETLRVNNAAAHRTALAAAAAVKPVAPKEEIAKTVQAGGELPKEAFAQAATAVPAETPAAKNVLVNAAAWAGNQADKHADRVAAHFGIDRERAFRLVFRAITAVAEHAANKTAQGQPADVNATLTHTPTGQTASLKFHPRTIAARQVVNDMADHVRGGHDLSPKHAGEFAEALDHLPPEEIKQLDNSMEMSRTVAENRMLSRLVGHAKQAVAAGVAGGLAAGGDALGVEKHAAPATDGARPTMTATAPAAPLPGHADEPPVPPGHVRLYHGGTEPTSGGGRWVTGNRQYAEGYARKGGAPDAVHYADVPETHPEIKDRLDAAEYETGERHGRHIANFEAPEEIAKQLKPVRARREDVEPGAAEQPSSPNVLPPELEAQLPQKPPVPSTPTALAPDAERANAAWEHAARTAPPNMDKKAAKAFVENLPAPAHLPDAPADYFKVHEADKVVPIEQIKNLRARPEGIENAAKFMEASRRGIMPKRGPLNVVDNGDGTFTVADGNSTFANAKNNGWKSLPVKIVPLDALHEEQRKTIDKEHGRAVAKLASDKVFTPEEAALPKKVTSAHNTKDELYAAAKAEQPTFEKILDKGEGVEKALGATVASPANDAEFNAALDKPGPLVIVAPLKGEARATQKVATDYNGNWNQLHDLLRSTIAVDSAAEVPKAMAALKAELAKHGWKIAKLPKNRFAKPTLEGYSDFMLGVVGPGGVVSEVQVHLKGMLKAKEKAHKLYETRRDLSAKMKAEGRTETTPEEAAEIRRLVDEQRKIYASAWLKSLGLHSGEGAADPVQLKHLNSIWEKTHADAWKNEFAELGVDHGGAGDVSGGEVSGPLRPERGAGEGGPRPGAAGSAPRREVGDGVRPEQVLQRGGAGDGGGVPQAPGGRGPVAPGAKDYLASLRRTREDFRAKGKDTAAIDAEIKQWADAVGEPADAPAQFAAPRREPTLPRRVRNGPVNPESALTRAVAAAAADPKAHAPAAIDKLVHPVANMPTPEAIRLAAKLTGTQTRNKAQAVAAIRAALSPTEAHAGRGLLKVPPPSSFGDVYGANPFTTNHETGLVDKARVGVPAMKVPTAAHEIPRLPNLSPKQRKAERRFATAYAADPDGMADKYLAALKAGKVGEAPNVFATDDVKLLNPDWNPGGVRPGEKLDPETQAAMAKYNTAIHGTANALAKRAFLKYLDTEFPKLPPDKRTVLVTNGGVAAGKGSSLARAADPNSPYHGTIPAMKQVGAVWDAAGEQNATENEWIWREAKKRGITPIFTYVLADPKDTWDAPDRGVIKRAIKKGRMVDARLFADSYVEGAKNMHAFWQKHKDDGTKFIFLDNRQKGVPKVLHSFPTEALKWDAEDIYRNALDTLRKYKDTLPKALVKAGMAGTKIWGPPRPKTR